MQTNEVRTPTSQHTWQMITTLITYYRVWHDTGCLTVLEFKVQYCVTGPKASCPQGWSLSGALEDNLFFVFFLILAALCIPWLLAASAIFIANSTASLDFFHLSHYFCWHITFSTSVVESLSEIYRYPLLSVLSGHLWLHLGFIQVIQDNRPISTCSHVQNPFYHKR